MYSPGPFEDWLPNTCDPIKSQLRSQLIYILNSRGEILPAAESPLGTLCRLLSSSGSSVEECQKIIELDPALVSRIFRVSNSAAFGGKARDISEAILHIGFKSLRELVFNSGVLAQFSKLPTPSGWELFWLRNLFVARLCDRMAAIYFPTDGSEYLAGLIHDIGWLFLRAHFPEEFDRLITVKKSFRDAEKEVLPFGHTDIAGAIAARSLLPLRVVNAIAHHHGSVNDIPDERVKPGESARFLGVIINICDQIADSCHLDLLGQSPPSLEQIRQSPEALWLNHFGNNCDFETLVAEELPKAQEIFSTFFMEKSR